MSLSTPFLPYWRNETSGKLAEAVHCLFEHLANPDRPIPDADQILMLRNYLLIWSEYDWQGLDDSEFEQLQNLARRIITVADIHKWIDFASKYAIDPF